MHSVITMLGRPRQSDGRTSRQPAAQFINTLHQQLWLIIYLCTFWFSPSASYI